MTTTEYLNSQKVSFVDIGYGEYFLRNTSNDNWEMFIKTPWSSCENIYKDKYEYNAIRLNNTYKENLSGEQYDKYIKNTFVFIDYEEKGVRVNRKDCFK